MIKRRIWISSHKGVNSSFDSCNISVTHYSFGPHSRTLFDIQLTFQGTNLIFALAINNFLKKTNIIIEKNVSSNSIPKAASTYSKNTWPKLFQVVLLMFMVIKIYQLKKERKRNSASFYHTADQKNIIGHLLQYIEIDKLKVYEA